jgi:hypothetical protein
MTEPMEPQDDTSEPAITKTVIAGIIAAAALLVSTRLNRSIDFLDSGELDQFKALVALAAPALAGILIRRKVTPTSKVQAIVETASQQAALDKETEIRTFLNASQAEAEVGAPRSAPRSRRK